MKKRSSKSNFKKYLYITLCIVGLLLATAAWKIYEDVLSPSVNIEKGQTTYLYVHSSENFETLAGEIEGKKVLRNTDALRRLVTLLGYENRIKPGRYTLTHDMSNLELIRLLVSGKQDAFDVIFRYAERKEDFASFWGKNLEADSVALLATLNDSAYAAQFDLSTENILTLFIPNTYNLYWNTSSNKLLNKLTDAYEDFWDLARIQKAEQLALTKAEVSILASIVQKETFKKEEMPIVAGVYYNRLKKGMLLQADPTVIYAMNDKSIRRVSGAMLNSESPYNTYRKTGLPPGPICIPSVQAINAVLNMNRHKYIYFCAKEDFSGCHNFAETFSQHQQNARKYQRELNRRGIR
jgi:UPF0755 protein